MAALDEKALRAINEYKMLGGVTRVTVALSGGADSMSLLHFLAKNSSRLGITVEAAHLNHNIRGNEAKRDEDFVKNICEKFGITLHIGSLDITALARQRKIGAEECGRMERYAFFERLRGENGVTATAHTASDNAETVLLNITRGCGIDGLAGIPAKRNGIIRPLIFCTREDVENYCRENSIEYVTDSTNLLPDYSRNRVRLEVLPALKTINPSAQAAINRLSSLAADDSALIGRIANSEKSRCIRENGLDIEMLKSVDSALLPHIIRICADEELSIVPEYRQICIIIDMIKSGSGALELRSGRFARIKGGILVFENENTRKNIDKFADMPFAAGVSFDYNGKHYEISPKIHGENKINKKLLIDRISCGIISCDTIIRNRRSGDVFTLFGRNCTKTVKKLFCEMKLSPEQRQTRLVIANGSTVLWIEGVGASRDAAPNNDDYYEIRVC